jgi:hypothetical protein
MACAWLFVKAARGDGRPSLWLLLGLVAAATALTRPEGAAYAGIYLIAAHPAWRESRVNRRLLEAAQALAGALPLDTDPLTRVEALLPYGEAVKTLEDWAVAAADLLPEKPVVAGALDFTAPDLRLERGDVAVTLEWIGEGSDGDYDPTDSGDEPLMRIGVERRVNGAWEAVDDASYCTNISARASQKGMVLAMQYVLEQVPAAGSIKRLMERMSWIELTRQDGDSPDFSRVPA